MDRRLTGTITGPVHHDEHTQFLEVGHGDPVELIAGRYEPDAGPAGGVLGPARDTLSGGMVTVLRSPAPAEPLARFQELDRLRRYATSRHPNLAGIRAVELLDDEFRVVCDPVAGVVLEPEAPPADLTVDGVREIAAGLLDAVAALHLVGVPQGWVRPGAVVVGTRPPAVAVTLLPLPAVGAAAPSSGRADEERQLAAALLLDLLRRVAVDRPDEAAARRLRLALAAAGGRAEEPWGPAGSALFPPAHRRHPPVPLSSSALSLAPLALAPAAVDRPPAPTSPPAARTPPDRPRRRRTSRRAVLEGSAAGIALAATIAVVVAAAALPRSPGGRSEQPAPPTARPAATTASPSAAASAAPSATPTPPSWDLPTTVPALVSALTAGPAAAGPSGPLLVDALRGLMSADTGAAQQSALRLVTLVVDDPGVDARYGATSLVALAAGSIPGAPGVPSACFSVSPGTPDPVVQHDAQQVLDRLAGWQALGLPQDESDRLRGLATPVAAARAVPLLTACGPG